MYSAARAGIEEYWTKGTIVGRDEMYSQLFPNAYYMVMIDFVYEATMRALATPLEAGLSVYRSLRMAWRWLSMP